MHPVKKRYRRGLTIDQKINLPREVDENKEMKCELASKYNIAASTLSTIVKNRDRLEENVRCGVESEKRHRTPKHGGLEKELYAYFSQAVIAKKPITVAILKEEAHVIAKSLDIADFKSSDSWLYRFMKRFNVKFSGSMANDTALKPKLQIKRMRRELTLSEKIKLLRDVDEKKGKKREIAAKYHIPASSLSTILKQRDSLEKFVQNRGGLKKSTKRLRVGKHNDLENELYEYYAKSVATSVPVSGQMLKEYAKLIALKLNLKDFEGSNGWLWRFFKRFDIDIQKKRVHQEPTMFENKDLLEEVESKYTTVYVEDFNGVTIANIAMDFEPWEGIVDFSRNCRLCLDECNDLTEIFCGSSDPNDSWVDKITSLIPIELHVADGLPQSLCQNCVLQLSQTHSFVSNSLLVDTWLRNRLNVHTDETKDEIVDSEVDIVPHGEEDPLAFEQYQHFEQPEQEGSEYDSDEESDQFDYYQDDELDDETYTDKPLKRKRGRPVGSTKNKNKPKEPFVYMDNFNDDTVPRKRGRPRKYPIVPVVSDLPKRKRGRPPGPKKPPKEKPTGNENYDCTVCQIKFFSQQTLTKHKGEKACVAAPKATPVPDESQLGLAKVKIDRVESLNESPDKNKKLPVAEGAANECDDDWWLKEAKESSDDDGGGGGLDSFGDDPEDPVILTCAVCEKTFTAHKSLKRHMRYHNERGRFKCDLCPLLFCNQTEQLEHYRTHTGDKPYACDKCPKSFTLKTSLTKHERTHTGERPFACSMCPKTFSLKCSLRKHRRIHTGERPFLCSLCPKTFASHTTRKMHVRTHTGEKPYACNFCPMSFVETSKRTLHERRMHTKECTVKCTACDKMFIDAKKRAVHIRKEHKDVE